MYKTLIVEPQEFSLNALKKLPVWEKGENGFICTKSASNGQEALALLQKESFDLVLTEINLPILDGLQLLKKIHKENQTPLVVFISDIVTFSYAREGFIYGVFDYLPKPVNKESINSLFERASQELEKIKRQPKLKTSQTQSYFLSEQAKSIYKGIIQQHPDVIEKFKTTLESLYHENTNGQPPDVLVYKLYTSIINGLYGKYTWLSLYLSKDFHKQLDYLVLHDYTDYIEYYLRKMQRVYQLIIELNPLFQDETLAKVHEYILLHPEEDLKLTAVADKFYLNHTYLSNLFSKKSSVRYNQLVTSIKLHRAEYLIQYTSTPLIDIAEQLGYKDFHYFVRLYKKTIGKAPSDYIREDYENFIYSI